MVIIQKPSTSHTVSKCELILKTKHRRSSPPGFVQGATERRPPTEQVMKRFSLPTPSLSKVKLDESVTSEAEMDKLKEKIKELDAKMVIKESKKKEEEEELHQKQDRVKQELECVICYEVPEVNVEVYCCEQQHLLCKSLWPQSCPLCKQYFQKIQPRRNRLVENIIQSLN